MSVVLSSGSDGGRRNPGGSAGERETTMTDTMTTLLLRRKALEQTIASAITTFELETDLVVSAINIEHSPEKVCDLTLYSLTVTAELPAENK